MRAETLALWGLMWFAHHLYIESIQIYGDSQVLIDHINKGNQLSQSNLEGWLARIKRLERNLSKIYFTHVYKVKNIEADRLSKKGLFGRFGDMKYELHNANGQGVSGIFIFL